MWPLLSWAYITWPNTICFKLLRQAIRLVLAFARLSAGSNIAARMAIMAITTRSSISVKAAPRLGLKARKGAEQCGEDLWNIKLATTKSLTLMTSNAYQGR